MASWALFTLHRKKLYEYRNANEQNISVKMSSPEHYTDYSHFMDRITLPSTDTARGKGKWKIITA
nr:hypothetical protein [Escherichia coli]